MFSSPVARLAGVMVVALFAATLSARASALLDAIDVDDIVVLQALSHSAPTVFERDLAAPVVDSLHHRDAPAEAAFLRLIASEAEAPLKAAAEGGLAALYVRQSRFAEAEAALKAMATFKASPLGENEQRTLDFVAALRDVPPMRRERLAQGSVPITRDKAGMTVVTMRINGCDQAALLDTGANFSVVSQSTADRLHLSPVHATARTGSSTGAAVGTGLAVADRIDLGATLLRDAVFMVMPDEALRFPDGYRIDAVIGRPVMEALGRLEFVREASGERLDYGAGTTDGPEAAPNLLMSGAQPKLLLDVEDGDRPLRLLLDSGASKTMLYASALERNPRLAARAVARPTQSGGVGGVATDDTAKALDHLTVHVGNQALTIRDVRVTNLVSGPMDGLFGQDLLSQGRRVVLDFERMQLSIEP